MKQQSLFKKEKIEFGGSLLNNKRKSQRPVSIKAAIFVTLKIDTSIYDPLFKNRKLIIDELRKWANKFNVQIYETAVCGNHMHFAVRVYSIDDYKNFIRIFTGQTAQKLNIKWLHRPHTRIIHWGTDFKRMLEYIVQNHQETVGIRPYRPR